MTYAKDATGPFYHGTRADLAPGDLLTPGFASNYADRKLSRIAFSGAPDPPPFTGEGSRCGRVAAAGFAAATPFDSAPQHLPKVFFTIT